MRNKMCLKKKQNVILRLVLLLSPFILVNCSGDLVLSSLLNNRLKMIVKGTLESNDPYDQEPTIPFDEGLTTTAFNSTVAFSNVKFYFDIAEVRIATGTGITTGTDADDYWEFFARDRVLLCSDYSALFSKELDTCKSNDGATKLTEFFNEGFSYPVRDVKAGSYPHLAMYLRKFVTSESRNYNSSDTEITAPKALFDNRQIDGIDVEPLYNYAVGDASAAAGRLFPLERTNLNLNIVNDNKEQIVEIRIFLKNIFMKHAVVVNSSTTDPDTPKTRTFIGVADWLNNHAFADTATDSVGRQNNTLQGGSILMTARTYSPHQVGHIAITDSGTSVSTRYYFVAVVSGSSYDPKVSLPLAATKGNGTATIKNLPINQSYDIYKICDGKHMATGGETNGTDGFPETKSAVCTTPIAVTNPGETVSATFNCVCNI